jgi:hypothetical protein
MSPGSGKFGHNSDTCFSSVEKRGNLLARDNALTSPLWQDEFEGNLDIRPLFFG